jgi:2'-5' RNA ligase
MRTFIAIEIPHEIKAEMAKAQEQLRRAAAVDAGWTRPEGIHLTLKFLGEVPEAKIPEILKALTNAAAGTGGFRLELSGVGTFPNPGNARVVWIGVAGALDRLLALQAIVEETMIGLRFEGEGKKFTPHLTLGRIKYIRSRDAWLRSLESIKDVRLPAFEVNAVSLMKSDLKSTGAVYTEIGTVAL